MYQNRYGKKHMANTDEAKVVDLGAERTRREILNIFSVRGEIARAIAPVFAIANEKISNLRQRLVKEGHNTEDIDQLLTEPSLNSGLERLGDFLNYYGQSKPV